MTWSRYAVEPNQAAMPIKGLPGGGEPQRLGNPYETCSIISLDNQVCGKVSREITVIQNVLRNPRQHATVCTIHLLKLVAEWNVK